MDKDDRIIDIHSGVEDSENSAAVEYTEEKVEKIQPVVEINSDKTESGDKKKILLALYDFVSVIISSFVIIAIAFVFIFRLVGVSGTSMTDTLQDGDWLITVQRSEYEYGDIVVITQETEVDGPLIKRVIATGGQVIDIDSSTDTVYVDGEPLDEPYIREEHLDNAGDHNYPLTVPEGYLFCMGDNRNGSLDSRSSAVGLIDERYVLGKAVFRLIPFGDFDIYDYE